MDRKIVIEVDDQGNFTYFPATLRVKQEDKIKWISPNGKFAISFMGMAPGSKVDLFGNQSSVQQAGNEFDEDRGDVLEIDAERPGHYHYSVAVATNDRVFLDSGCPDIVVSE